VNRSNIAQSKVTSKVCENVLKVKTADGEESYLLADNDVSRANHEKVCGPASPATVTGSVTKKVRKRILTATAITQPFERFTERQSSIKKNEA